MGTRKLPLFLIGAVVVLVTLLAPPLAGTAQAQEPPWPYWQCGHVIASHGIGNICPPPPDPTTGLPPTLFDLLSDDQSACGEGTCCDTGTSGKPVDLWNGREFFTQTDLVLPGFIDIVIRRSYDSQAQFDSALGYGWALGYFMRLYEFPDGSVIIRRDCGVRRPFNYTGGAYQSPAGESGTLTKNPDGTWTLREVDWEEKVFDAEGRLAKIVSPGGPYLQFQYDQAGLLPLIGLSPYSLDDSVPIQVASEYRLTRIDEYNAAGNVTGNHVLLNYDASTGRLDYITDSALRLVDYKHDSKGNLERVDLPENGVLTFQYQDPYDPHNATLITSSSCPSCSGPTFNNVYDASDRVKTQTHGAHFLEFFYDIEFEETRVEETTYDEEGQPIHTAVPTTYQFNQLGNPLSIVDSMDTRTEYLRDSHMNPFEIRIYEHSSTTNDLVYEERREYTSSDQLKKLTEAFGFPEERVTDYIYYPNSTLLWKIERPSVVVAEGHKVTEFLYDISKPALVSTQKERGFLGDTNPFEFITSYTYDANGRPDVVDGPRPGSIDATDFDYDLTTGRLSGVNLATASLTTSYTNYNAIGFSETVTDPNGVATTFGFDDRGRVQARTISNETTEYLRSATGKLTTLTFPKSALHRVRYTYDTTYDRIDTISIGEQQTIRRAYDSAGNMRDEEFVDESQSVHKATSFIYDRLHRLERVVFADQSYVEHTYDGRNNRLTSRDAEGNPATVFEYDAMNRLKVVRRSVTSAAPLHTFETRYDYDAHGNLDKVTQPGLLVTTYAYDDMGRVFQSDSPDVGITNYWYDEAGNVTERLDARGVSVTFEYDGLGRLLSEHFPTDPPVVYTYDSFPGCVNGAGRLCHVDDFAGTTLYSYDEQGRVTSEHRSLDVAAGAGAFVTQYVYDANGALERIVYPSGRTVRYERDRANRPTAVFTATSGGAETALASGMEYRPFGPMEDMVYGNSLRLTLDYDSRYFIDRSTLTATMGPPSTIRDLDFSVDSNGNIETVLDMMTQSIVRSYDFDEIDRLVSATGPWGTNGGAVTVSRVYDDRGNIESDVSGGVLTTYQYHPGSNRLAALNGGRTAAYQYDDAGYTTDISGSSVEHDESGLLRSTATGVGPVDFERDYAGRRAVRISAGGGSVFLFDVFGQLIAEADFTGAPIREYADAGSGAPLAMFEGTETLYLHYGDDGAPSAASDDSGSVVWSRDADPFQLNEHVMGTASVPIRQLGQRLDAETGLVDNWLRVLEPESGRYLSTDPLGERAPRTSITNAMHFQVARATSAVASWTGTVPDGTIALSPLLASAPPGRIDLESPYSYAGLDPLGFGDPTGAAKTRKTPGVPGPGDAAEAAVTCGIESARCGLDADDYCMFKCGLKNAYQSDDNKAGFRTCQAAGSWCCFKQSAKCMLKSAITVGFWDHVWQPCPNTGPYARPPIGPETSPGTPTP